MLPQLWYDATIRWLLTLGRLYRWINFQIVEICRKSSSWILCPKSQYCSFIQFTCIDPKNSLVPETPKRQCFYIVVCFFYWSSLVVTSEICSITPLMKQKRKFHKFNPLFVNVKMFDPLVLYFISDGLHGQEARSMPPSCT